MNEVTRELQGDEPYDPATADQLLPLIYDELKSLANARMASERAGHTLQATALVSEAYARLVGPKSEGTLPRTTTATRSIKPCVPSPPLRSGTR